MAKSAWVKDVNEAEFEREVLDRSREAPVVVDFWAPWCGPCRMLGPILEKLTEERAGEVLLAKVNTDENPNLAMEFGIQGIPAVKAFRDGRLVLEFVGLVSEAQLREVFDRLSPSEADKLVRQAATLEENRPEEAERLYRQALEKDPRQVTAELGLARLLLARSCDEEAAALLDRLGGGGDLAEEYDRLQAMVFLRRRGRECGEPAALQKRVAAEPNKPQLLYELGCALAGAGRYPEALEQLLKAAEGDRKLAADKVREVMVKIFQVIGVRSPLADEYRDKLTRVLY